MGFLGKLVGGTIGFAIGGPLGALAGAAFGHTFDRAGEVDAVYSASQLPGEQAQAQLTFFVGTFSMLAKLVRSDGRIAPEEVDSIERFMAVDLSLDPESRRAARQIFNRALEAPERFEDYAQQFYGQFRGEPHLLEMMVDIMLRISIADGGLSDTEASLIASAVRIFHLSDDTYAKIKARYQIDSLEKYYLTLETTPAVPDDVIKKQYRKLVSAYHPDKIASKGLPEPFIRFAGDKFREIQEAYEKIKAHRGMS